MIELNDKQLHWLMQKHHEDLTQEWGQVSRQAMLTGKPIQPMFIDFVLSKLAVINAVINRIAMEGEAAHGPG